MAENKRTLLVVDDEPGHRLMLKAVLSDAGWEVLEAGDGASALKILGSAKPVQAVLLDMRMPGMDGMQVLARIREMGLALPVILLTAYGSVGSAVEAMKRGAFDYLTKPADNEEIKSVLEKAFEYGSLLRADTQASGGAAGSAVDRLIGESLVMRDLRELILRVAPSEATLLILGESGTGKELVAEAVHAVSDRAGKPLVKVNCAAIPENLLESELFGYVKGAFTGAGRDKPGRFQLAHGGTLFLDEIGEVPLALQAKLLRALQERVVEPLGGVKPLGTDVRIIAATNRDLAELSRQGKFREDLYFRLNVIELKLPPLRERISDLPLLVKFLLAKLGEKNKKSLRSVSPEFMRALGAYAWPGNVRELENVLERALILSRSDTLGPETLPAHLLVGGEAPAPVPAISEASESGPSFEQAEKETILAALKAHNGHRERTAQALGVSRRTLQYKLSKYGLQRRE